MKTEEDEAFDELAKRQGDWGGGFPAKRAMAADKLQPALVWPENKTFSHWSDCAVHNGPAYPAGKCDCGVAQKPVAWFRYENGMRIYYETKAWDDLQALYTTPPLPAQPVQEPVARVAEVHMSRYTLLDKPVREPVEKKEYTMGDWFNDLENPHGNR